MALGLDALASVAYGPEAIVVVLAAAGAAGIAATLPVTAAIVVLLVVLVICYRQVIAAYPDGGGAYTVARENLGRPAGLVAAASLVVDYVLNVAVSIAAGVAALTSAFPALLRYTTLLCLAALVVVTLINLRGVLAGARLFILPALLFVVAIASVIVIGLIRGAPSAPLTTADQAQTVSTVGIALLLSAFANGCSALTGIEAIANATPTFRPDSRRHARSAEALLGLVLGVLLLGLATLIVRDGARPIEGRTLLSIVTQGAVGSGWPYVLVQLLTVLLLALAANTSFGGLPVLAARLARDDYLPHVFAIRADRLVHRWGVLVLAGLAAVLLLVSRGQVNLLVPVFALGVFVGFFLAQVGLVRHWYRLRPAGWQRRIAVNVVGAVLTGAAVLVLGFEKFTSGAWIVVLVIPLLTLVFAGVHRTYARLRTTMAVPSIAGPLDDVGDLTVVVPIVSISTVTAAMLRFAERTGGHTVAVHIAFADEDAQIDALLADWRRWRPDLPLIVLRPQHRELGPPLSAFVDRLPGPVMVVLGEIQPSTWWVGLLKNGRAAALTRHLSRHTNAAICRLRVPVDVEAAPAPLPTPS